MRSAEGSLVAMQTQGRVSSMRGVGAVLHLAGGVAFGVDVGDLLELEGAFEGDGIVDAAAEEEEVAGRWRRTSRELAALVIHRAEKISSILPGIFGEFGDEVDGLLPA